MEEALQQIFQKVFTLQDFLRIAFSDFPSARKFTRNLENPQFLFLLENALVAPMDEISDIRFTAPIPPPEAQNWSMKRIVQECMSKGNRRGRTLRISKGKGTPHATIGFLITQEWELLLQRIGPIPIMHLLCNCHVFVPILDDDQDIHLSTATQKKFCFLQISGTPICFMKRNAKAEGMSKRDNEEIGIAASSILYKRASRPRKGFHRERKLLQISGLLIIF